MKDPRFLFFFRLACGVLYLACIPAHTQQLIANFNATSFNSTNDTLTDSVGGIVATAVAGTANAAGTLNGAATVSIGNGFTFNADSVTGLEGLTSYTIALGFVSNPTQSEGIFGADIPGPGAGDVQLASEGSGTGMQLHLILGNYTGGDNPLYAVQNGSTNYNGGTGITNPNQGLVTGSPTGLVLVVNNTAGTVALYVNGYLDDNQSFTVTPFGHNPTGASGSATSTYSFGIGTDAANAVDYNTNALQGSLTDFQIYNGALSGANAAALSVAIIPEPSTRGLLLVAIVVLAIILARHIFPHQFPAGQWSGGSARRG